MIDQASVFAERFKGNPQVLQATVLGQGNIPGLDPYTALNALRLIKESNAAQMAAQAQQPTSSPSIVAENMAPPPMQQGLGAMVPNAMGQAPQQAPQGQAPQAPQAPVMQASGGLAGMPVPEEDYAAGGIVAFAGPTRANNSSLVTDDEARVQEAIANEERLANYGTDKEFWPGTSNGEEISSTDAGTDDATKKFNSLLGAQITKMQGRKARTSPDDQETLFEKFLARETKNAGPDIYAAEIARGAQEETDRGKRRNTGEAMALLTAAGAVLKGRNLSEGASNALPAYASAMNEVDRADQAVKSANAKMQFALKDAQRKERAGNVRAATASMENYRKFQQDENKAEFELDHAVANLAAKGVVGNRPTGKGAGAQPSAFNVLYDAKQALSKDPKNPLLQAAVRNAEQAAAITKASTSYSVTDVLEGGPKGRKLESDADIAQAKLNADIAEKAAKAIDSSLFRNPEYVAATRAESTARVNGQPYTGKTAKQVRDALVNDEIKRIRTNNRGGAAAPPVPTALSLPANKTDLQPNQIYNTAKGLAVWNGTSFVPQ